MSVAYGSSWVGGIKVSREDANLFVAAKQILIENIHSTTPTFQSVCPLLC